MFDAVVSGSRDVNAGALIIRIKLWGPFYCHYNKRPPPKKKYQGPYINRLLLCVAALAGC